MARIFQDAMSSISSSMTSLFGGAPAPDPQASSTIPKGQRDGAHPLDPGASRPGDEHFYAPQTTTNSSLHPPKLWISREVGVPQLSIAAATSQAGGRALSTGRSHSLFTARSDNYSKAEYPFLQNPLAHLSDPRRLALVRPLSAREQAIVENALEHTQTARALSARRAHDYRERAREQAEQDPTVSRLNHFMASRAQEFATEQQQLMMQQRQRGIAPLSHSARTRRDSERPVPSWQQPTSAACSRYAPNPHNRMNPHHRMPAPHAHAHAADSESTRRTPRGIFLQQIQA